MRKGLVPTKASGFTLIELLVVISIIGILAVFLVPNLLGVQDKGREAAVKSVMHSVQLALEAYNMENFTYPMASAVPVESLCNDYLSAGGYISEVPKNPFTGLAYTDADVAGKIIYSFDDASGRYILTGFRRDGARKLLELSNM